MRVVYNKNACGKGAVVNVAADDLRIQASSPNLTNVAPPLEGAAQPPRIGVVRGQ